MHELSLMTKVVESALESIEKEHLKNVTSLEIEVGEMTGALPDLMQECYRAASSDIPALKDSRLIIHSIPITACCDDCGTSFTPSRAQDYRCPHCHSLRSRITAGRGITIKRIITG